MVYQDDDTIMIGGVLLPGLYKKVEVKTAAKIDEQEVEGSSAKPKQATGYEDAQISIELELHDSEAQTKEDKLAVIQNLFRMRGQELPEVYPVISTYTAIRNVDQVLIKDMSSQSSNKKDMITVTLELMEYIPQTIKAKKKSPDPEAVPEAVPDPAARQALTKIILPTCKKNEGAHRRNQVKRPHPLPWMMINKEDTDADRRTILPGAAGGDRTICPSGRHYLY